MPRRPARPCTAPGCSALVRGKDPRCDAHAKAEAKRFDRQRGGSTARGYGASWRRLRRTILARDLWCCECKREPATEVDHIVPKRDGGTDDPANLQGLCKSCHSAKTAREVGLGG